MAGDERTPMTSAQLEAAARGLLTDAAELAEEAARRLELAAIDPEEVEALRAVARAARKFYRFNRVDYLWEADDDKRDELYEALRQLDHVTSRPKSIP